MKNKILKSLLWFILITLSIFILLNLFVALFSLADIIKDKSILMDRVQANVYWSLPIAILFGIIAGIFNYQEWTFKLIKEKFKSWFGHGEEKDKKPLLADVRDKNEDMKEFDAVVKKNSSDVGVVVNWDKDKNGKYSWSILSEAHIRALGTTGAAKSQFFILPNIYRNLNDEQLEVRPNMLIIDPKGELYENSLKMNKKNYYNLVQIDMTNPNKSIKWNPLGEIWDLYQGDRNSKNLAISRINDFLNSIPDLNKEGDSPIWNNGAKSYLESAIKFMLEYPSVEAEFKKEHFHLMTLFNLVSDIKKFKKLISWWANKSEINDYGEQVFLYPKINELRQEASYSIDAPDGTRGGFHANATSALKQFVLDPSMWEILKSSDLDFKKMLGKTDKPTSLYITYPDDRPALFPLVSLVISQVYQSAIDVARKNKFAGKGEKLDRTLQMFIDEFGILPKLNGFDNWINIARSRKIQIVVAYQDQAQLNTSYEKTRKVIESGFSASLLLATSDPDTAEQFSKMIGNMNVEKESKTYSKDKKSDEEASRNISTTRERVIQPEEIIQLDSSQYILLMNNKKPAILGKKLFFKEMGVEIKEESEIKLRRTREHLPQNDSSIQEPLESLTELLDDMSSESYVFNMFKKYEAEELAEKQQKLEEQLRIEQEKQLAREERQREREEKLKQKQDKKETSSPVIPNPIFDFKNNNSDEEDEE